MTQAVQRHQRFTKERPCPICGGWDAPAQRGSGRRCHGYMGADGKYAHCSREELAGGLPQEQLETYAHRLEGPCNCGETHGDAPPPPIAHIKRPNGSNGSNGGSNGIDGHYQQFREVKSYEYEGGLVVVRAEDGNGNKTFWQRHRVASGAMEKGAGDAPRTLYRADEVRATPAGAFVFLVEGEKCADALCAKGLIATTTPGGAKAWAQASERATEILKRRDVVILPDNDEPGRKYAEAARDSLVKSVASLRILDLPGLADAEDVYDWLARGGDAEDLVRMADLRPDLAARYHPKTCEQILLSDLFSAPQQTFSTGFKRLDELLDGGVKARQVTAIAAPTGAGKSAFALELTRVLCTQRPVLYITTELEPEEIAARTAGPLIGARASDILALRADPRVAAAAVKGWPIFPFELEDEGDVDPLERVRLQIQVVRDFTGITPIVLVDYLQELAAEDAERRRGAVARVAKRLRLYARKLDTAIIAISSVARSLYSPGARKLMSDETDPRSWLSSAKESGEIEYAAAVFVYLDTDTKVGPTGESSARLIVAKSRRGRVGFVGLRFHGPTGRFWEHEEALNDMGPEKRVIELENKIMEIVRSAKTPKTKDEIAKAARGNRTENLRIIGGLISDTRLEQRETRRMGTDGKIRKTTIVIIPGDDPPPQTTLPITGAGA